MVKETINNIICTASIVIDKIDSISKGEQLKFCELLEHRKISTFELPKSCVIIVTANEINKDKISEEIFSLVARIWGVSYEIWYSSIKKKNAC